eukprot:s221_g10.t1
MYFGYNELTSNFKYGNVASAFTELEASKVLLKAWRAPLWESAKALLLTRSLPRFAASPEVMRKTFSSYPENVEFGTNRLSRTRHKASRCSLDVMTSSLAMNTESGVINLKLRQEIGKFHQKLDLMGGNSSGKTRMHHEI